VILVGPPAGLSMVSVPSTAAARCASPGSPLPLPGAAPPPPSSLTTIRSRSPRRSTTTSQWLAWACLATLVSASETTK
jgi:hypothetical protein